MLDGLIDGHRIRRTVFLPLDRLGKTLIEDNDEYPIFGQMMH